MADHVRLLGPADPRTLHVQVDQIFRHTHEAGTRPGAITLAEQIIADVRTVLGPDHADLETLRNTLYLAYRQEGRDAEAEALGPELRT